jgi:hypothetical protein
MVITPSEFFFPMTSSFSGATSIPGSFLILFIKLIIGFFNNIIMKKIKIKKTIKTRIPPVPYCNKVWINCNMMIFSFPFY